MKNSSLIILSVLVVLLAVLSTLDTEQGQECSRSHRTYSYHPVPNAWSGIGEGTSHVPQEEKTGGAVVPPTEANAADGTLHISPVAGSPLGAPPAILEASAMAELTPVQLPPLDAGMVNVTGIAGEELRMENGEWRTRDEGSGEEAQREACGYRMASPAAGSEYRIALPYDPALLPQGFTEDDIRTYVYDRQYHRWVAIQRDSVNEAELLVYSRFARNPLVETLRATSLQTLAMDVTDMMRQAGEGGGDSPLDFINAVLKTPEMPETSAYTPTSIKELKAADPLEGLTLMQPPTANNSGTANLSYPIEIPAGRQGMQPNLALTYSSGGGNGWLGVGWDISIPSITVETRWGVPRYDQSKESEVYVYEGEQLVSKDGNGIFREMPHRTNQWTDRIVLDQDGYEQFYPRRNEAFDSIVRHGSGPDSYWWTVTHKNGVTDYYGKYALDSGVNDSCVLRTGADNTSGAIGHWALAESVDPFGNSVRYHYDVEQNAGISGSSVIGRQIYLRDISYTCHSDVPSHYSVSFVRKTGRRDVVITANRGFKEVTADVLCYAEVRFDNEVVRRYMFYTDNKRESQYKTRLTDVVRIDDISKLPGCDSDITYLEGHNFSGIRTHFDYYDAPSGNSIFGSPQTYNLNETNDGIQSTFVTQLFNNTEGMATALGGTKGKSWSLGGTASVGVGFNVCMTTVSVGGNFDYSRSSSEGMLTLIDLDGDGLADKVFRDGNGVSYRKRLQMANDSVVFGPKHSIVGVSDFLTESSSTTTWGLQASAGCSFSGSWPTTKSTTTTYFADVNADGLPDLITEEGVLFNTTQQGGTVSFKPYYQILEQQAEPDDQNPITVNSALPCEQFIFDGEVNDSIACELVWVFDKYYEVKACQPDEYEPMRIFLDSLLGTGEYAVSYGYDNIDTVGFQAECYHPTKFWVYRKELRCSPPPLDPDIDAVKVWVAPKNGSIMITSNFRLLEDTSVSRVQSKQVDGVRYAIQHNRAPDISGDTLRSDSIAELYSQVIAKDDYSIHTHIDTTDVLEGDILFFRLQSQGSRAFDVADWQREIRYLDGDPGTDQYGLDTNRYSSSEDFTVSGQHYFQAHKTGAVARIKVHVKTGNVGAPAVLNVWHTTSGILFPTQYTIYSNQDDVFDTTAVLLQDDIVLFAANSTGGTNWGEVEIRPHIEYAYWESSSGSTIFDTLDYYPPVDINYNNYKGTKVDSMEHRLFGPLYRGWGQFAYNNNDSGSVITDTIDISTLVLDPILLSDNPDDTAYIYNTPNVNANSSQDDVTADYDSQNMYHPLSNATRWIEMQPESRFWSWVGYGNINYIMRDTVTNTRLPGIAASPETSDIPEYDHPVPQPMEAGSGLVINPKTVRKQNVSKLRNYSLNFSIPVVPISTGSSWSNGENRILTDYMDLNGDRYPDVLGEANVQYTMPWGGIGTMHPLTQHVTGISGSGTNSDGTTFGASYSMPKRGTSNTPRNSKISFDGSGSLSATIGNGTDNTDYLFMDVNGDGLPDKVTPTGGVALNTGYSFLPFEDWHGSVIRNGESVNSGLSIGLGSINIAQASISGGLGVNQSENRTKSMLMDFNGDGLPDKVTKVGGSLIVSYNYGNGQWSPAETVPGISDISYGTSYSESANAGVTIGFTFFGYLKVNVGVQTSPYNRTFSKDRVQLTDINGDGYIDYVTSNTEGDMTVRYNLSGKTNLLRKVTNFTGSTVEMDYALSQPCFEKPQRGWLLDTLTVADINSPLSGNVSSKGFRYADPHHDRNERMDYGYGVVTTREYDTDGGDTLYRNTVEEYENRIFNKRGRKTRDCVYDAAGRPYVEHLYDATVYDYAGSVVSDDSCARADLYVASESVLTNYYEGYGTPQITTRIRYLYDNRRNVTEYTHFGDTTHHDEYFKAEISYVSGMPHNLVALPEQIEVTDYARNLMQKRSASYYPTGKLRQLVRHNNFSQNAQYDFTYDSLGNLATATLPANLNGQRMAYEYTFDDTVHTYPIKVKNTSLGFVSTAEYNLIHGKPTKTVDINGNEMRYRYDTLGRNTVILAPYEIGAGRPYTIRMEYHPKNYGSLDIADSGAQSYACTYHYDIQHPNDPIRTTLISDGMGRLLQTKKDAEIGGQEVSLVTGKVVYDCFGRTVAQYHPFTEDTVQYALYNDSVTSGTATMTEYDILDRQTRVTLPLDSLETTFRYGFGNFLGSSRFLTEATDPNGNISSTLAGGMRQKLRQTAPDSTVTLFEYDCLGRLVGSTDPDGFSTTYTYDMLGRMVQRIHPDAGTDLYTYDPAGNVTHHKNGNNRDAKYSYYYNLLTGISYPDDTASNIHYIYGGPGASRNSAGRVLLQEDASGWQAFSYGALGEITETVRAFVLPNGSVPHTFAMGYRYDSWNRLQSIDYPDGEVVSYGYNAGGLLRSVAGQKNGNSHSYIDSVGYNRFELKEYVMYGNGAHTKYSYDLLMRLSNVCSRNVFDEPMQNIDYAYDGVGNITDIDNNAGALSNGLGGEYYSHYDYDMLYRLEHTEGWWGDAGHPYSVDMKYSGNGRILRKSLSADVLRHNAGWDMVEYDNIYRYTTGCNRLREVLEASDTDRRQAFEWDRGGNMIVHDGVHDQCSRRYCWDSENRLASFSDCHNAGFYQYDAGGERTYKLTGEIVLQNIGGQWYSHQILDNPTLYVSPYLVCTPQGYTKHYYAESERIASRIGSGGLSDSQDIPHVIEMPEEEPEEPEEPDEPEEPLNPGDPGGVLIPDWPAEPEEPEKPEEPVEPAEQEKQPTPPFGLDWDFEGNMSELFDRKQLSSLEQMDKALSCAGTAFEIADDPLDIEGWAVLQNPDEPDCYWYHPDHLGSSSWITYTDGSAVQHLHYLPWGEDYVDQRTTNWSALHTFSAKERDAETGLSYFGARYYSSDLSIWLSIDPQAAKYPSLSPYVYCANNPIKLVDPNGEDYVVIVDEKKQTMTIKAIYYTAEDNKSELQEGLDIWNSQSGRFYHKMNGKNYEVVFDLQVAEGDFSTDSEARSAAFGDGKMSINNYFEKSSPGVNIRGATTDGNIIQLDPEIGGRRSLAHEIGHTIGIGEWTFGLMSQGTEETQITRRNVLQTMARAGLGRMPKATHFYNNPVDLETRWSHVGKGSFFTIMNGY